MIKKMDKTLLITSVLLLVIGLIMVFSASNVTSFMKYKTTPYHFFNRQLFFLIISLILSNSFKYNNDYFFCNCFII